MPRDVVSTTNAPKPAAAYSQGVRSDRLIFTSGQIAADPATGQPVSGGVREHTRQALRNLQAILEAAGTNLGGVIKTTCFLSDINEFAAFNEVYREFFPTDPPARSTIQVVLAPPWLVEIEAVAERP